MFFCFWFLLLLQGVFNKLVVRRKAGWTSCVFFDGGHNVGICQLTSTNLVKYLLLRIVRTQCRGYNFNRPELDLRFVDRQREWR